MSTKWRTAEKNSAKIIREGLFKNSSICLSSLRASDRRSYFPILIQTGVVSKTSLSLTAAIIRATRRPNVP